LTKPGRRQVNHGITQGEEDLQVKYLNFIRVAIFLTSNDAVLLCVLTLLEFGIQRPSVMLFKHALCI
jgi:hypothetical protein